jgi:hypothetical protein
VFIKEPDIHVIVQEPGMDLTFEESSMVVEQLAVGVVEPEVCVEELEASMKEVGESKEEESFASDVKVHVQVIYFRCVRGMPEISQACAGGGLQLHTARQRNVVG